MDIDSKTPGLDAFERADKLRTKRSSSSEWIRKQTKKYEAAMSKYKAQGFTGEAPKKSDFGLEEDNSTQSNRDENRTNMALGGMKTGKRRTENEKFSNIKELLKK